MLSSRHDAGMSSARTISAAAAAIKESMTAAVVDPKATVADWPEVPAGAPLVQLRDVRKTYDVMTAPMRALRGVDLEIASGEFVALAGASGSGKSTLLSVVAGLERHDDGLVMVAGSYWSF